MSNKFFCPACMAHLNPGTKIVMRISKGRKKGLILLSPQVGNYTSILPEGFGISRGEKVHFECPVCGADLTSGVDRRLSEVLLKRGEGDFLRVNFSNTYGEEATFVITDDEVRAYGSHAGQYSEFNFFGAGSESI